MSPVHGRFIRFTLTLALVATTVFNPNADYSAMAAACTTPTSSSLAEGGETYTVQTFTSANNCTWAVPSNVTSLEIVLVGGGGGAGFGGCGGGGGAGRLIVSNTRLNVTPLQDLTLTVGGGGTGGWRSAQANWTSGTNGGDTTLNISGTIFTATGGGGGAGDNATNGAAGGSGGGAKGCGSTGSGGAASNATNPAGVDSYGNVGSNSQTGEGAGGGGAGGLGSNNGNGGNGRDVWGVTLAAGGAGWATGTGGSSGVGGSATGTFDAVTAATSGSPGSATTGSGGGGGNAGGSGRIMIRYIPETPLRVDLRSNDSTSFNGVGTNWNDLSTSNNDATLVNGPAWNSSTFTLDGVNDYFELPSNSASLQNFSNGISISVLANFGAPNSWERLIDFGSANSSNNIVFARNGGSDNLTFEIYQGASSIGQCTATNGVLNNKWATYAVVANGSTCTIYRDGAQIHTQTYNSGSAPAGLPLYTPRSKNYIGKSNWNDAPLAGGIRAVTVYGRALSGTEINDLRNSQDVSSTCRATTTESGTITTVVLTAALQTTSCANSWTVPTGVNRVQALLVGGGGSGAHYYGGGGGGGGVTTSFYNVTPGNTYNLNVGGGGARVSGTQNSKVDGLNGSQTTISIGGTTYTAPGGSGGRGCIGTGLGQTFTCSSTNTGGAAGNSNGGAGGVGIFSTGFNSGATGGGTGFSSTISGSSATYGSGGNGASSYSEYANSGVSDSGNGGDGGFNAQFAGTPTVYSGAGAAGIIIIRYKSTPPVITGPGSATGSTSSISIPETATRVHTFSASEAVTWSIAGTDQSFFSINETGTLTITARDFESPADVGANNTYIVEVTGTDGFGATGVQTLTVTITNVNEAPTITTNSSASTYAITQAERTQSVATFAGSDVDTGTTLTWSISGTDFGDFTINSSTGALAFASLPNFEAPADSDTNNVYTVIVTVSDGALTDTQTVTVTVTDINDAPTITSPSTNSTYAISQTESTATGITYAGSDEDTGTVLTWSISGTDAARFAINSSTGALTFAATPNFEVPTDSDGNNTYIVTVTLSDGTLTDTQTVTITITNTNEAPIIASPSSTATYSVTQAEGISSVATFTGTDVDSGTTLSWSISGTDAADFTINSSTGVLAFAATPNFESAADSDTNNVYTFVVTLSDGALTDTQTVTVTITNINEAPTITTNSSNATYSVSQAESAATGIAYAGTDQDAGATLSWSISGTDAALFAINSSTGALTFIATPNFEAPTDSDANNTYIVTVTLSDGTLTDTQTATITISNTNEAPTITNNSSAATYAISQGEGQQSITTFVGSDVDSGTTLSWSISGTDASLLTMNSSTGVLSFNTTPNFEIPIDNGTNNTYVVVVSVTDGSLTDTQTVTITITDINEAPTISTNSSASTYAISKAEESTTVTTFSGNDVDAGATLTWSISGTDAADLLINSSTGALRFITAPNFENPLDSDGNNTYIVDVTLSDGTLTDIQTVTITITNVNEAPIITTNNSDTTYAITLAEGITNVTTYNGRDVDAGASLSWSISGTDAADFSINSTSGALTFVAPPSYLSPADSDTNNTYIIIVTLSDGSLTDTQTVTVTIQDINNAPTITTNASASTYSIAQLEGQTQLFTYTGTDVDLNTTLTWSISGTDAAAFAIDASTGALTFLVAPDYEAPVDSDLDNNYVLTVTLSDGTLTDTQILNVVVTNMEDLSGYFDGNSYLTTSDGASFIRPNTTSFTVEAWFKADTTACASSIGKICIILDKPNQYRLAIRNQTYGLVPCFYLAGFNYSSSISWTSGLYCVAIAQIRENQWNHLMLSVRRGSGTYEPAVSLFFNGFAVYQFAAGSASFSSTSVTGTEPLTIGGETSTTINNFVGEIDQVRISAVAQPVLIGGESGNRVLRNFTDRLDYYQPNDNGNLVAHYDFNEESGSTVINRAPNAVAGTDLTLGLGSLTRRSVATVAVSGNYTTYTFPRTYLTASGGWKVPAGVSNVSALIVGGGGAGGTTTSTAGIYAGGGGGGGAGEYRYVSSLSVNETMTVIVGQGGTPVYHYQWLNAGDGGDSQFGPSPAGSTTAAGGGAGGSYYYFSSDTLELTRLVQRDGYGGGSGGGGAAAANYSFNGSGGSSVKNSGSGNSGGAAAADSGGRRAGGGGGGAGGSGEVGSAYGGNTQLHYQSLTLGAGGRGLLNSISGTPVCYATGGGGGDQSTFGRSAGGGCSATVGSYTGANSVNGNGGTNGAIGNSAAPGTGSGGGGAGTPSTFGYGGAGGSGIVIVRYVGKPNFGEPPAVETVTAGVVHRFNFETPSDVNISRTFLWEHTNGTPGNWTRLTNSASYYDFKSPGSLYLETTTSGSAYSFRVTITDTEISTGVTTSRVSNPFYVVVNPRNQINLASYTYNETTTVRNETMTSISAGTAPDQTYTFNSKYGDSLTAVMTFGFGTETRTATVLPSGANTSGFIEWSNSSTSGITMQVKPTLVPGTYYETLTVTDSKNAFTRLTIRIQQSKADTITVVTQIASLSNYQMSYGGAPAPTAIRTVSGLKNSDTLTALSTTLLPTGNSLLYKARDCASGGTCNVGDLAPGGGRVFYVSSTPINSVTGISNGGIYLATAPSLMGPFTWCSSSSIGGVTLSKDIGTGAFNTSVLTSNCTKSTNAGRATSEIYDINGYDDWFLPSSEELFLVRNNLVNTGILTISEYLLSSSMEDANTFIAPMVEVRANLLKPAALYNIGNASTASRNILPIRAFSPKNIDLYNSPTDAGTYSITAQIEMASPGTFANYQGVQYTNATLTINRAAQTPISIGQFNAVVGKAYPFNVFGGTGPGILVRSLVNAGTAGCSYNSATFYLTATSAGTCTVLAIKAGTPNYLTESLTATIAWTQFVITVTTSSSAGSIPLAGDITVTKRTDVVTSSAFLDTNDQPIVGSVSRGASIRIVISGYEGLTIDDITVYFKPYEDATVVSITPTYIQVVVPSGAITGKIAIDGPRGVAYSPSLTIDP